MKLRGLNNLINVNTAQEKNKFLFRTSQITQKAQDRMIYIRKMYRQYFILRKTF